MTESKKTIIIVATILTVLLLGMVVVFAIFLQKNEVKEEPFTLSTVVDTESVAKVSKFYTYGTHFGIEGELVITDAFVSQIQKFEFVLLQEGEEKVCSEVQLNFDKTTNTLTFDMGEYINIGVYLDSLSIGNKYALIKATLDDQSTHYFTMVGEDETGYGIAPIEYYTVTKNGKNNKIDIEFKEEETKSFLALNVSAIDELPEGVYDIVVDPGHGGKNPGAVSNDGKVREDVLNLKHANLIAEKLRALGYKVYVTRDGTEDPTIDYGKVIYGEDGRLTKALRTSPKLFLAIHCNASGGEEVVDSGGLEIYVDPKDDFTFARNLVNNIVSYSGTHVSSLSYNRAEPGIYPKSIVPTGYKDILKKSKKYGFEMYDNISEETAYYYFIRETGGIVTGAYVDGRDPEYDVNLFVHTNRGVEGYLLELAYMDVDSDLNYILENYEKYCEGVAVTVDEYFSQ